MSKINKHIVNNTFKIMLFLNSLMIAYFYLSRLTGFNYNFASHTKLSYTILLAFFAVFSMNSEISIKKIKLGNQLISKLNIALGLSIIIIGCINEVPIAYVYFGIQLLFIIPTIVTINNLKHSTIIIDYLSIAFSVICIFYYIFCLLSAKNGNLSFASNGAFMATTNNQNLFAFFELPCLYFSLYILFRYSNNRIFLITGSLSFSISFLFVIMTNCRSAFISVICILMTTLFFIVKKFINTFDKKREARKIINRLFILIVIVASIYFLNIKMISINDISNALSNNEYVSNEIKTNYIQNTLNRFSSGYTVRLKLWSWFIKNTKIFGNNQSVINQSFYVETGLNDFREAHNIFIEIGFWFGLIVELLFAVRYLLLLFKTIKDVLDKTKTSEDYLLKACIVFSFSIISLLDIITIPQSGAISLMYYLLPEIIDNKHSKEMTSQSFSVF